MRLCWLRCLAKSSDKRKLSDTTNTFGNEASPHAITIRLWIVVHVQFKLQRYHFQAFRKLKDSKPPQKNKKNWNCFCIHYHGTLTKGSSASGQFATKHRLFIKCSLVFFSFLFFFLFSFFPSLRLQTQTCDLNAIIVPSLLSWKKYRDFKLRNVCNKGFCGESALFERCLATIRDLLYQVDQD